MTETITLPREVAKRILRNIEIGNKLSAGIEMRREIEAALEQPQDHPEQHPDMVPEGWKLVPVAYYVMNGAALFQLFRSKSQADALAYDLQKRHDLSGSLAHFHVVPLYIRPQPPRQPLTDAQINDHRLALPYDGEDLPDPWDFKQGVRAAERAHGIGGEA